MNRLFKNTSLILLCMVVFACTEDQNPAAEPQAVSLSFVDEPNSSESNPATISSGVQFIDGLPKLVSNDLVEVSVINSTTGETTYAYVLKSAMDRSNTKGLAVESGGCEWSVTEGYGFTGRCFEYGTFITGSNCETIFIPCGINCYTFGQVCPDWNEAFV